MDKNAFQEALKEYKQKNNIKRAVVTPVILCGSDMESSVFKEINGVRVAVYDINGKVLILRR